MVRLSASKNAGLLKNQLNLGMTGRYKGPMMNMRYYDRSFSYFQSEWELVSRLFEKWKPALQLKDQLIKVILNKLISAPGKEAPELLLHDLRTSRSWRPLAKAISTVSERKGCLLWLNRIGKINLDSIQVPQQFCMPLLDRWKMIPYLIMSGYSADLSGIYGVSQAKCRKFNEYWISNLFFHMLSIWLVFYHKLQ